MDLSKMKDLYLSEAEDNIQVLNDKLIQFEKGFSGQAEITEEQASLLNDLMRASHTIKGSSAAMGYVKTAYLTHVMEDVFDGARNKELMINKQIIDQAFLLIDCLAKSVKSVKENDQELDFSEETEWLKRITGVATAGIGRSPRKNEKKKEEIKPTAGIEQEKKTIGKKQSDMALEQEEVAKVIGQIEHIKVPVARMDALLELVEELLIDKLKLEKLAAASPELKELYNHLGLITSSIQYQIMQARLIPVDEIFARFPRMMRDLAKRLDKEIEFVMTGGEIELDRAIVDKLGEPILHLLRNAADHGVKTKGRIALAASRRNNYVVISVENDGQGLDYDKIKRSAVAKGVLSSAEAGSLAKEQIAELIFNPVVSTKNEVTDLSGRGVGLNIVKRFAESSGGAVTVADFGTGVRFNLTLPLTLAIINSLLVEVSGKVFALPFSNIERSVLVSQDDVKLMADSEVAVIDGVKVPLLRLEKLLRLDVGKAAAKGNGHLTIVLIRKEEELIGIIVDKLLSEQEIIVKPLASVLRGIKGLSGSTIMGDGRVALILDIAGAWANEK